jgi:DNA-binding CsgD family transcriptional regulator
MTNRAPTDGLARSVVGRRAELAHLDEFLASRSGGVLVLEGEPGIGKTTVWLAAVAGAEADGYRVLVARPAEAEAKLSFSAVADLAEPLVPHGLEALPDPQRAALDVALLRGPSGAPAETRAVAAAFRSLLAAAARDRPVLVAIDDAQWLDGPSATVIEFALRRVGETVALLATRRPGDAFEALLGGDRPVRLGPLTLAATHHVIVQELGHAPSRSALTRIHDAAGGNPFYALQIARIAADTALPPGSPVPVPPDHSRLVQERVAGLRPETRDVLLTAAMVAAPSRQLLTRIHGDIAASLEEAEEAAILEVDERAVRFVHPLYAAAIYASSGQERRRRFHANVAAALDESEEQARHLALAATPPDEETARRVHAAARQVAARGAHAAAAELLEQSIALGAPEPRVAAERLVDLGDYLHTSGDSMRAAEVLRRVESWNELPVPTQIRGYWTLTAAVYWTVAGDDITAPVVLGEELLRTTGVPTVRAALLANLAAQREYDIVRGLDDAEAALALLEPMGADADPAVLALALGMRARNRLALGLGLDRQAVERAIALEPTGEVAQTYGQWLKYVDDFDGARQRLEKSLRERAEVGDDASLPNVLQQLAMTECWAGNLELAAAHADRAVELASEMEITAVGPLRVRTIVEAHRGNEAQVRADARRLHHEGWRGAAVQHVEIALGLLELSLGRLDDANRHLGAALSLAEQAGQLEPGVHRAHGDAAEVALALGDRERAVELAAVLDEHGRRTDHRWSTAVGARSRALIHASDGDVVGALQAIGEALAVHERLAMPYERGRTLLARGQIERRAKRRREARDSLEEARAIFERIGAKLWAQRAADELRRIPIRRRAPEVLTETEERVAELAASGMTNREVAAALFVSPKTVEANLARVYRKLDIKSRAELGAQMANRDGKPKT